MLSQQRGKYILYEKNYNFNNKRLSDDSLYFYNILQQY